MRNKATTNRQRSNGTGIGLPSASTTTEVTKRGMRILPFAAVLLLAFGTAVPGAAHAWQDPSDAGTAGSRISKEPVTLQVESADLYFTLKLLFNQIKADFTLDNRLKGIPVTISLKKVPFNVALESVLRASQQPITWTLENGVYSIVEKVEVDPNAGLLDIPDEGLDDTKTQGRPVVFSPGTFVLSGIDIANALGGRTFNVINYAGANRAANPMGMGGFGGGMMGGMGGGMMGGMGGGMMGGMGGGMMGGMGGGMGGGMMGGMGGGMGGGMMGGMGGGMGGGMMGGFGGGRGR